MALTAVTAASAQVLTEVLALSPTQREAYAQRSIAHIRAHFTTGTMTDATLAVYREVARTNAE